MFRVTPLVIEAGHSTGIMFLQRQIGATATFKPLADIPLYWLVYRDPYVGLL